MIERVVVTGASSGIGAACVEVFQNDGAEVLGVDVLATSAADDHLQIDLGESDCGIRVANWLADREIDALVNNAAVGLDKKAVETSAEEFDRVIAVNLRSPFMISSALQSQLARRKGCVINVGSVHAVASSPLVGAYAASKGGLVSLTRALAVEWAPDVRVCAVLPGAVDTQLLKDGLSRTGASITDLADRHLLGRVGEPNEIASAIRFLSTSGFSSGSILVVDGGATARLSTE